METIGFKLVLYSLIKERKSLIDKRLSTSLIDEDIRKIEAQIKLIEPFKEVFLNKEVKLCEN